MRYRGLLLEITNRHFHRGNIDYVMPQILQGGPGLLAGSWVWCGFKNVTSNYRNEMPKPTIAMVNGPAAGAGMSLALIAPEMHVRVTSVNPSISDMTSRRRERRKGPIPDSCTAANSISIQSPHRPVRARAVAQ